MSKRLRDSEEFPPGARVEVTLAGVKKLRGKVAWSVMSEMAGYQTSTVLRVDYDAGGWYLFIVKPTGESICTEASLSVITNEGAQLELL